MKKLFALLAIAFASMVTAKPIDASTVKGPVVLGHLDGKTESAYIPFSKTDGNPVIATEQFAMPRIGAAITSPFSLVGVQGGNKLWIAKYISGTGHKDAPTDLTADSQYIMVGGREYGANSYRGIGYGYVSSTTDIAPVFTGILERNAGSNTYGDFIIATRGSTSNVAPDVRLTVTYDGKLLAASGYKPTDSLSLVTKEYVDSAVSVINPEVSITKAQSGQQFDSTNLPDLVVIENGDDSDAYIQINIDKQENKRFWLINKSDKQKAGITHNDKKYDICQPNETALVVINDKEVLILSKSTHSNPDPIN